MRKLLDQLSPMKSVPDGKRKKILIVEDSKIISLYMKRSLEESHNFAIIQSYSVAETRAILDSGEHDFFAAVLDLNLPDAADGQVVDLVLAFGIPSIVFTSLIDQKLRLQIEAKGVVDYVLKSQDAVRQVTDLLVRLEKNQHLKILVVEDSSLLRHMTTSFLERFGFIVLEAANGADALEILEQERDIPLVITDYEMPKMNGFELIGRIRAQWSKNELVIIGISSHENDLLSARLIKAGANDFLAKPFQREELYTRIVQNLETLEYIKQIKDSLTTIRAMHSRMKRDLEAAAQLQQSLLPQELPEIPGVRVASIFVPCDELAGDTYNIFRLDETHMGIFVVDVSGHGVPAALLSVTLSRLLWPDVSPSTILLEDTDNGQGKIVPPCDVCKLLNKQFPMNPDNFQYFTFVYGILDITSGTFIYANAGHPGPIRVRPGHKPQDTKPLNMAIGFVPNTVFCQEEIILHPGDRLYFYTDGIVEAKNMAGEEFGTERLCATLQAHCAEPLEASLQKVYSLVEEWNVDFFHDDVTMCAVEYISTKQLPKHTSV